MHLVKQYLFVLKLVKYYTHLTPNTNSIWITQLYATQWHSVST